MADVSPPKRRRFKKTPWGYGRPKMAIRSPEWRKQHPVSPPKPHKPSVPPPQSRKPSVFEEYAIQLFDYGLKLRDTWLPSETSQTAGEQNALRPSFDNMQSHSENESEAAGTRSYEQRRNSTFTARPQTAAETHVQRRPLTTQQTPPAMEAFIPSDTPNHDPPAQPKTDLLVTLPAATLHSSKLEKRLPSRTTITTRLRSEGTDVMPNIATSRDVDTALPNKSTLSQLMSKSVQSETLEASVIKKDNQGPTEKEETITLGFRSQGTGVAQETDATAGKHGEDRDTGTPNAATSISSPRQHPALPPLHKSKSTERNAPTGAFQAADHQGSQLGMSESTKTLTINPAERPTSPATEQDALPTSKARASDLKEGAVTPSGTLPASQNWKQPLHHPAASAAADNLARHSRTGDITADTEARSDGETDPVHPKVVEDDSKQRNLKNRADEETSASMANVNHYLPQEMSSAACMDDMLASSLGTAKISQQHLKKFDADATQSDTVWKEQTSRSAHEKTTRNDCSSARGSLPHPEDHSNRLPAATRESTSFSANKRGTMERETETVCGPLSERNRPLTPSDTLQQCGAEVHRDTLETRPMRHMNDVETPESLLSLDVNVLTLDGTDGRTRQSSRSTSPLKTASPEQRQSCAFDATCLFEGSSEQDVTTSNIVESTKATQDDEGAATTGNHNDKIKSSTRKGAQQCPWKLPANVFEVAPTFQLNAVGTEQARTDDMPRHAEALLALKRFEPHAVVTEEHTDGAASTARMSRGDSVTSQLEAVVPPGAAASEENKIDFSKHDVAPVDSAESSSSADVLKKNAAQVPGVSALPPLKISEALRLSSDATDRDMALHSSKQRDSDVRYERPELLGEKHTLTDDAEQKNAEQRSCKNLVSAKCVNVVVMPSLASKDTVNVTQWFPSPSPGVFPVTSTQPMLLLPTATVAQGAPAVMMPSISVSQTQQAAVQTTSPLDDARSHFHRPVPAVPPLHLLDCMLHDAERAACHVTVKRYDHCFQKENRPWSTWCNLIVDEVRRGQLENALRLPREMLWITGRLLTKRSGNYFEGVTLEFSRRLGCDKEELELFFNMLQNLDDAHRAKAAASLLIKLPDLL